MSSFYLCNSAAIEAGLSKSAFLVYSYLAISANSKTRASFKARATIAAACGISVSTVVRACRELCKKGLLQIRKRFEGRRQTSNLYILLDNQQLTIDSQASQSDSSEKPVKVAAESDSHVPTPSEAKAWLFKCNPAVFRSNMSSIALKVYSYLSLKADKNGMAMPAKKDIAASCGISVSTVTRGIRQLRQAGLIEVHRQTRMKTCQNNGTSVNLYILQPSKKRSKKSNSLMRLLFNRDAIKWYALCSPSARANLFTISSDTHPPVMEDRPRTTSRRKATLKQRKEYFYSKLPKRIKCAIHVKIHAENTSQGTG